MPRPSLVPVLFALLLVLIVVPIVELAVFVEVSGRIGILNTVGLLLLISIVGVWLVRRQGLATLQRIRSSLAVGVVPTPDLVDGAAILLAGGLLVLPGFVTDAVGLLLLFPPTRSVLRRVLRSFFVGRVAIREVRFRRPPDSGWPPPEELPPPS